MFPISFALLNTLEDMTPDEQTQQISPPVKVDGAYFVVAISARKSAGHTRSVDVGVGLFCISVPVGHWSRENFPIKKTFDEGDNVFDASKGLAFHVVGRDRSADVVHVPSRIVKLDSRRTAKNTSLDGEHYDGDTCGLWTTMLENHRCSDCIDGGSIGVSIEFREGPAKCFHTAPTPGQLVPI